MATHWSLCEPGGILSVWNSSCCNIGILGGIERSGTLDRDSSGCYCADIVALNCDLLHKLGKAGNLILSSTAQINNMPCG